MSEKLKWIIPNSELIPGFHKIGITHKQGLVMTTFQKRCRLESTLLQK